MKISSWLIAVGPLVSIGLLVWFFVVRPMVELRSQAVADFVRLDAEIERMSARLGQLQSPPQEPGLTVDFVRFSSSLAEAASGLQSDVVSIAERSGMKLTRFSSDIDAGELLSFAIVSIEGNATIGELGTFLEGVSAHTPRIAVPNLSVRHTGDGVSDQEPRQWVRLMLRSPVELRP